MATATNRQVLLAEIPKGKLAPEHFRLTEAPMPAPKDGEVLLRVRLHLARRRQPRLDAGRHLPRGGRAPGR